MPENVFIHPIQHSLSVCSDGWPRADLTSPGWLTLWPGYERSILHTLQTVPFPP